MVRPSPWCAILALAVLAAVPAAGQDAATGTRVVILGTGTPNADPERSGPAVAVIVGDTPFLVDLGPGVIRRAAAAARNGESALRVSNLKHAFITHLHSDHTLGYPDFIFSPWVLERMEPATVFGPPGLAAMTEHLQAAYAEDRRIRLDGLEPANPDGYRIRVREIAPGVVFTSDEVTVEAVPVQHGNWEESYAYVFTTRDRKIVISGDATPSEAIVAACDGCDVLVHEVYSAVAFERRPPEWQRYHAAFHTSTYELAELAARARPKLLVMYHQLYWGTDDAALLEEIRSRYDGAVMSAHDLAVY